MHPVRRKPEDYIYQHSRLRAGVLLKDAERPDPILVPVPDSTLTLPPLPRKVYIESKGLCFLEWVLWGDKIRTITDRVTSTRLRSARLGMDLRISRLLGIVGDPRTSRIQGLLLTYIESGNAILYCVAHRHSREAHPKWLQQITDAVRELHTRGIVWPDVKPDNAQSDEQDDAYLIEFGGSYTRAGYMEI